MKEPILREHSTNGYRVQARGGLHMIRGNGRPYFSLTMASWLHGREDAFGAAHRELVKLWPELQPLAALHLSDIHGVPMHAEANGWYWMAGACGGLGERYHGGNSERQHWKPDGEFNGYRMSTPDECLQTFADYVRVTMDEARQVRDMVMAAGYEGGSVKAARAALATWVEQQKPRWAREAAECIQTLGLQVYGDAYTPEAA